MKSPIPSPSFPNTSVLSYLSNKRGAVYFECLLSPYRMHCLYGECLFYLALMLTTVLKAELAALLTLLTAFTL